MSNAESAFVDVYALRVGHFVLLDMGWLAHPFPSGSFKITTPKQIETIQGLGLKRVRHMLQFRHWPGASRAIPRPSAPRTGAIGQQTIHGRVRRS